MAGAWVDLFGRRELASKKSRFMKTLGGFVMGLGASFFLVFKKRRAEARAFTQRKCFFFLVFLDTLS